MEDAKNTPIAREKFEDILKAMGVQWIAQSGFHKVDGPKGRRLYVANGKTTARVDISGFTAEFGTRSPHTGVFGNVKQQLEMRGLTEEEILRNFSSLVEYMMALPPVEPKAKKAKAEKAPKAAGAEVKAGDVLPDDQASKEARAKRLELIKRVAAEKGVGVSKETLDLGDDGTPPTEQDLEELTAPSAEA